MNEQLSGQGKRMTDSEVSVLINLLSTDVKERKRYWYTLGIKINHYYSLDEQLDAIRQLGLSGNPIALDYLNKLNFNERVKNEVEEHWQSCDNKLLYNLVYPNANGKIKRVLRLNVVWGDFSPPRFTEHSRRNEARGVLNEAISELEKSLK
ncbi:MAG: hypothetical protein Q8N99_06720 [Nanoarchaeota archaeon]|nr:hypothetical protein [Nanoarchaeota archaeon]